MIDERKKEKNSFCSPENFPYRTNCFSFRRNETKRKNHCENQNEKKNKTSYDSQMKPQDFHNKYRIEFLKFFLFFWSGREIPAIWHTAIVVYDREYFFGGRGIESCIAVSLFFFEDFSGN